MAYRHLSFIHPHRHRRLLQALRQSGGVWPQEYEPLRQMDPEQWPRPFTTCDSLESLREYAQLLPQARFELTLAHSKLSARKVEKLRESEALSYLCTLDLESCELDDAAMARLLDTPHLHNLRSLSLRGNTIGPLTQAALFEAAFTLSELDLSDCDHSAPLNLFSWVQLPGLKALHMSRCGLGTTHIVGMPAGDALSSLESLTLDDNPLGTQGCMALSYCEPLSQLKILSLKHTNMSNASVRVLANTPYLLGLESLRMDHNQLYDEGCTRLIERGFEQLSYLDVSFNRLGNGTLQALEHAPSLPSLKRLHMRHNMITDRGALSMTRASLMDQLTLLDLSGNAISQRVRELLIQRLPEGARGAF